MPVLLHWRSGLQHLHRHIKCVQPPCRPPLTLRGPDRDHLQARNLWPHTMHMWPTRAKKPSVLATKSQTSAGETFIALLCEVTHVGEHVLQLLQIRAMFTKATPRRQTGSPSQEQEGQLPQSPSQRCQAHAGVPPRLGPLQERRPQQQEQQGPLPPAQA